MKECQKHDPYLPHPRCLLYPNPLPLPGLGCAQRAWARQPVSRGSHSPVGYACVRVRVCVFVPVFLSLSLCVGVYMCVYVYVSVCVCGGGGGHGSACVYAGAGGLSCI